MPTNCKPRHTSEMLRMTGGMQWPVKQIPCALQQLEDNDYENDDYQKTDHDLLLRYQEDLNKVSRLNLNSPNGISSAACAAQPLFLIRYGTLHKPEYHDNEKYDQQ